jgi:hypothetical protein
MKRLVLAALLVAASTAAHAEWQTKPMDHLEGRKGGMAATWGKSSEGRAGLMVASRCSSFESEPLG